MAAPKFSPYTDIPFADLPIKEDSRYGSDFFRNVAELQVGYGSDVMRVDRQGLWLGAERFQDAPFSVDMQGNVTASSLSLGTLSGSLDDIDDGVTYKKPTANEVLGGGYGYSGLNSSGEIIKGFLNSQLSSKSLPSSGVRVDSNGIYGRDSGTTTFYISSTGDAYFSGDIAASSMTASTISGTTITGSTLTTATSGQRVVLTSTLAQYYNSSGTKIVEVYASSNDFYIKGSASTSRTVIDVGSSGYLLFAAGGSSVMLFDTFGIQPMNAGTYDLGNGAFPWNDIYNSGVHVYQGIDQPVVYWGYVEDDTTVSDDNGGFSCSSSATGVYQVTHNLGTTNYVVTCTARASTVKNITVSSRSSNSFTVRIANLSDVLEDNDFMFILCLQA
jgi:hypothetical protein